MTLFPYDPKADGWNTGDPWTESCIQDLKEAAARGETLEEIAVFIQRNEDEILEKARELGISTKGVP
jgi:hypothetical protein